MKTDFDYGSRNSGQVDVADFLCKNVKMCASIRQVLPKETQQGSKESGAVAWGQGAVEEVVQGLVVLRLTNALVPSAVS